MTKGDRATCQTCGEPIDFVGSNWRHTGGQKVGHPAVPPPNDDLRMVEVIRMPLTEFKRRFGFRPTDKLEKWYFSFAMKRLDAAQRRDFESGKVAGPIDPDSIVMED